MKETQTQFSIPLPILPVVMADLAIQKSRVNPNKYGVKVQPRCGYCAGKSLLFIPLVRRESRPCTECGGDGVKTCACTRCAGTGRLSDGRTSGKCGLCRGTGWYKLRASRSRVRAKACAACRGSGKVNLTIPIVGQWVIEPCPHCK